MKDLSQIPIFFIIGRPRTGTTLLRTLFDAHPHVIIPWECQYIVNLFPKYHKIEQWNHEQLLDFYDDVIQQWQFKLWTVDNNKLREDLLAQEGDISFAKLCKVVHVNFQSFYEKKELKIIGDKNPGYTIYIDKLKKLFPEAKFIYITRDYRANFLSIKKVDFELPLVSVVTYKWRYFIKQVLIAKQKYPDSIYIMKYEDLVRYPEIHFRNVCRFLNVEYLPEVFDFYKKKKEVQSILSDRAKKNHQSLLNPINTDRIDTWKSELTDEQIKIADHVAGKYAKKSGYQRIYKRATPGVVLKAFPGILYARMLYLLTSFVNTFPYKLRATVLSKGPLLIARSYLKIMGKKHKNPKSQGENPKSQYPNSK